MSTYKADDAASYEQSMGRWSSRLAPLFTEFAALKQPDKILEVGCGTGSLTFALAQSFPETSITAMDYSKAFVEYARSRTSNPSSASIRAMRLPFDTGMPSSMQRSRFLCSTLCPMRRKPLRK